MAWSYFRNPFDNVSKTNFKRMLLLARDHRDKLSQYINDPEIAALYQTLNAAFTQYETAYTTVNSNAAFYRGNTKIVEGLFYELSSQKIRQWDIWIQNVFLDNSPQYSMLLPNNRKPYQTGAYEMRIDAVSTLEMSLQKFPQLNNVLVDVQTFLQTLNDARTAQQQAETVDTSLRQGLENSRLALSKAMHKVFGFLLYKHSENPDEISRYYEMKYLQTPTNTSNKTFVKYSVSSNGRITLFDGQLGSNSLITVKVKGAGTIKLFTTSDTNATPPNEMLEVNSSEEQTFYASEISDNSGFNWLVAVNDSGGEIQIEVAKEEVQPE